MGKNVNHPRFPLYIPSKGRWESRMTAKALDKMGVDYRLVIEPEEFDKYAAVVSESKLLVFDQAEEFNEAYDYCDEKVEIKHRDFKGSGPKRNFIWEHAKKQGYEWHWIMDDNIRKFYRLNRNSKIPVGDGTIFRCMEDFALRYENVAMAGPQYFMFAPRKEKMYPFVVNTRIYSCNLIRNDLPFRWRGRFNEDTILSIDLLKAGYCTILFNAFLQCKIVTQKVKGGNTEAYKREGTFAKSEVLTKTHPDVARIAYRFKRWHHYVDYSVFTHPLKLKPGIKIDTSVNEYGMRIVSRETSV